jgi:AcrR family transcriptional regulator
MAYKTSEITRERLIRSGEWLLARRGIGSVSAREVAKHAEMKNNFSVAYHFGSMDGLIRNILRDRVIGLEGSRQGLIDAGIAQGEFSLRFWLECLLHPQLQARDQDGYHAYASILCQYLPHYYPKGFPWQEDGNGDLTPAFNRIVKGLRSCVSDLPSDIFDRRLTNASLLYLNVLVGLSGEPSLDATGSEHYLIKDAIRQSIAVLTAEWID